MLAERVALDGRRLDAGAQRGGDLVRLAAEIGLQVRAPHLQRGVPDTASTDAMTVVVTSVTRVPRVMRRSSIAPEQTALRAIYAAESGAGDA
jgi:hypothetical protein